jgi:2-keto-4-pentenoate hydratase/2-oxohepta-3-ene-1,7-dioic acid hydratase in catechol pathway
MQRFRYQSEKGAVWGELEGGQLHELSSMLGTRTGKTHVPSDVILLAPCEPTKIVCVGKNYAKHIKEMGGNDKDLPKEPGIFLKGINALSNPGDPVPYPKWTSELHYEGELAVVIARQMKNIPVSEALQYVLGYTCACDVTARDKQKSDLQWTRGKASDKFCPIGPWLETDLDTSHLSVQTRVNGELRQDGNTEDLIFSIPVILSYISSFMTLEPGDVVLTGTPDGVGPLKVGDTVEVTVEGIGTLTNIVEREGV